MKYNQDNERTESRLSASVAADIGARLRRYHEESGERELSSDLNDLLAQLETSERRLNSSAG